MSSIAAAAATVLSYSVVPTSVPASQTQAAGGESSNVALTISATNNTQATQTVSSITVTVTVGGGAADLPPTTAQAQVVNASVKTPGWAMPSTGTIMSYEGITYLTFTLTPEAGGALAAGTGVTVTLSNITVNDVLGQAVITIGETLGSAPETSTTIAVQKISPTLQTNFFEVLETEVRRGGSPTLSWGTSAANGCTLYVGSMENPSAVHENLPANAQGYTLPDAIDQQSNLYLTASGGGHVTPPACATILVANPAVASFNGTATLIQGGQSVSLSWQAVGTVSRCFLFAGDYDGQVPGNGIAVPVQSSGYVVTPGATTTYTLVAYDDLVQVASATAQWTVAVLSVANLAVNPPSPANGTATTVSWIPVPQATATYVTLDPWPDAPRTFQAPQATAGSFIIAPIGPTSVTVTIVAEANGQSLQASQSVSIAPTGQWSPGNFGTTGYGQTCNLPFAAAAILPAPSGPGLVAISPDGTRISTSDASGANWQPATQTVGINLANATGTFVSFPAAGPTAPTFGKLYAIDPTTSDLYVSQDAVTWSQLAQITTGIPSTAVYQQPTNVALATMHNGLYWVALIASAEGPAGQVNYLAAFSSPDLRSWTPAGTVPSDADILQTQLAGYPEDSHALLSFNGQLVLVIGTAVWSSPDGVNWTQQVERLTLPPVWALEVVMMDFIYQSKYLATQSFVANNQIALYSVFNVSGGSITTPTLYQQLVLINSSWATQSVVSPYASVPAPSVATSSVSTGLANGTFYSLGISNFLATLTVGGPPVW